MLRFLAKRRLNIMDLLAIIVGGAINTAGYFWVGLIVVIVGTIISTEIESRVDHGSKALGEGQ